MSIDHYLAVGLLPLGCDGVQLVNEDDGWGVLLRLLKRLPQVTLGLSAILDIISGPLIRKKKAPVSLVTVLAIKVLPVPEKDDLENNVNI